MWTNLEWKEKEYGEVSQFFQVLAPRTQGDSYIWRLAVLGSSKPHSLYREGSSEFFQVSEPFTYSFIFSTTHFVIFPSYFIFLYTTYISSYFPPIHCKQREEEKNEAMLVQVPAIETCFISIDEIAQIFSKCQSLYRGGKFGIFPKSQSP